jgi:hypothetical protein
MTPWYLYDLEPVAGIPTVRRTETTADGMPFAPQHHDRRPMVARRVAAQHFGEVFPAAGIGNLRGVLFDGVFVQHHASRPTISA